MPKVVVRAADPPLEAGVSKLNDCRVEYGIAEDGNKRPLVMAQCLPLKTIWSVLGFSFF
jgi:hypothetical protein